MDENPREEGLSESMRIRVRQNAECMCENIMQNPVQCIRSPSSTSMILDALISTDNEVNEMQKQEALWLLFDVILERVVKMEELDDLHASEMIAAFERQFFTSGNKYPSSIFEQLRGPYKLIFASLFSAQPAVSKNWRMHMLEDVFYNLGQANPDQTAIDICHVLQHQEDPVSVLDAIDFIRSLAAYAVKNEAPSDDDIVHVLQQTLNHFLRHSCVLVRHAAADALWYVQQAHSDDGFAVSDRVIESGLPVFGSIRKDDEHLKRCIHVPEAEDDSFLSRISSDAIGIIDRHGLLQRMCIDVRPEQLTEKTHAPVKDILLAIRALRHEDESPVRYLGLALQCEKTASADFLRYAIAESGTSFSDKDWSRFVHYIREEGRIKEEYEKLVTERYGALAERNRENIVSSCSMLDKLLHQHPDISTSLELFNSDLLADFDAAMRYGDHLHALEHAYNLALILESRGQMMGILAPDCLAGRNFSRVLQLLEQTWALVAKGADELAVELNVKKEAMDMPQHADFPWMQEIGESLSQSASLRTHMRDYFRKRLAEERGVMPVLHARPVSTLKKEQTLLPFGEAGISTALIQQMNRPAIRQKIEGDLGISLADIPLRSQIHLLRFLADKDSVIFDRLRSVLQKHPTHSKNILLSFLACSEDQEMGNIILALAAYPELLVALDRYGDMAKNAEALTANLASLTHGTGKSQFDSLHFYRQLIVQSNRTLRDAVRMIHESPEKAEEVGQLCADHVRFSQDRVGLLHAIVRTLPRAEVTSMDLIKLPLVTITEGLVSEIGVSPAVRGMTRAAFPSETDQQEFSAFIKREGAVLTVSLCEDHALGMFGSEPLADGRVRHIDWYCTNKEGPVRGLAEPTLRTALHRIDQSQMLTCVASPESASCETFIEHAGMVACGVTEPGEYEGQYLRLRRVSSDAGLHGRALHPEQIDVLRTLAQNGNGQVVRSDIDGTEYAACIAESDSVETFFNNARHQWGDGTWVMSRQIREPSSESKKVRYLCIFEHDRASDEERETIHRAFDEFRTRQRLAAEDSQSSSNAIRNIDTME